ncbi:MAG: S66 peptidase family protein [Persicimonas sp.]
MRRPLIRPRALSPGDRVRVISPAGPVTPELLEEGLETLRGWGLSVELDEEIYARCERADYLAGEDAARLAAVERALEDPDIKAVVFSRGGYGTMRLLEHLDADALRAHPKLWVGFSDITALHLFAVQEAGLVTLHGPVVKSFRLHREDAYDSLEKLRAALFGERGDEVRIDGLRTVRKGRARGPLLGGNLSLVAAMVGSPYCPDLNGAILLLEEVGEEDYRLDRLFTSLRLSERAAHPAGIVLGDFTKCAGAHVDAEGIDNLIAQLAREFDCPVVADFPTGHGSRNVPVPMGVEATLDAARGTLTLATSAVT